MEGCGLVLQLDKMEVVHAVLMAPMNIINHDISIKINEMYIKDLELMLCFLDLATDNIDLNQLAYRKSTHLCCSDSCPVSIEGYTHNRYV